ncbi:hypothetical protein ACIQXI_00775 [Lysinibacillus sp. NPDC097195]|uniref:hypothetical protein n=1 Tax=Lysinibacillus sp. NPDC097195 TaxID=3364141 RepID=UPI0037FD2A3A
MTQIYSRGNRVFYDESGRLLFQSGEVQEANFPVKHEPVVGEIAYVDLEFNSYDVTKQYIDSINPETKKPIFKMYPEPELTEEQAKIKKLEEDILLLKTDSQVGGIL